MGQNFQLCQNRSESSPIGRIKFPRPRKGVFGVWGPLVGHSDSIFARWAPKLANAKKSDFAGVEISKLEISTQGVGSGSGVGLGRLQGGLGLF